MATTYEITWTNGRIDGGYETYKAACEAIRAEYPDAEIGHDGDLEDYGDRTLAWATEEDADGDDGAQAVASIRIEA